MATKGDGKKKAVAPMPSGEQTGDQPREQSSSSEPSSFTYKNFKPGDSQIKPGMLIWTPNPNTVNQCQFGQIKMSYSRRASKSKWNSSKHFELVLEVNTQENYVTTVTLTSMHNIVNLKQSNVPEDKWKYLIPLSPKMIDSSENQHFKVSFKPGSTVAHNGGWFIVSAPSKIYPNKHTGLYKVLESEMPEEMLNRLLSLARENEPTFNEYVASLGKLKQHETASGSQRPSGSGQGGNGSGKKPAQGSTREGEQAPKK